jgi:hypothetical protein
MVKKSAKSKKAKPAKNRTTAKKAVASKKAVAPRKGDSLGNELRSAAKASAARRLKK